MGKKALLTLSLCATLATCAPAALAIPASPTPTPGSQVAVAYRLPGQAKVEGMNLDTYYHPASTQKLLTAVAALLVMGPDYTMETSLALAQGASGPDASGTVHGDLVLRFSGDPSLSAKQFLGLFEALRKAKVKSITGRLILDVSRFGGLSRGQGWSWSDLPACFTAPASPVIIDRNCAFAELTTHGEGEPVTPAIPAGIPVSITADAVGIKASLYGRDCEMETNLYQGNAYHVQGCVPIVRNKRTWPLSLAVSDPLRWGRDWADRALSRLKISATGGIAISHEPVTVSTTLASHRSKPLAHLVRYMLVHSNNLYADSIAKNLTYEYLGKTATYTRMALAIRRVLKERAGIDLAEAHIVDGSGLSPHNLITPRQMLSLLEFVKANDSTLGLIDMLPLAGKTGTLAFRASVTQKPLRENVRGKTGTLVNVSNLAGFVTSASGASIPFVIFTNSITHSPRERDRIRNGAAASSHYGYERYVLEQIQAERHFSPGKR